MMLPEHCERKKGHSTFTLGHWRLSISGNVCAKCLYSQLTVSSHRLPGVPHHQHLLPTLTQGVCTDCPALQILPRGLRSLATLPLTSVPSHILLEVGLPGADQLPTGTSKGPRCHFPVKTKKDGTDERTAYIFQKSELGHCHALRWIADLPDC